MPYSLQIITPSTIINISHKATSFLECIDQAQIELGKLGLCDPAPSIGNSFYASIVDEPHPTYQDSNGGKPNPPTSRFPHLDN